MEFGHFLKHLPLMNPQRRVEPSYLRRQQFVQQLAGERLERELKLACLAFLVICDEWSAEVREACAQLCHRERAGLAILRQQNHHRHRKPGPQSFLGGTRATGRAGMIPAVQLGIEQAGR